MKFIDHPVDHSDSLLINLTIIQKLISPKTILEYAASVPLLELLQGLPLLVPFTLPQENGKLVRHSLVKGHFILIIVVVDELVHDFQVFFSV